MNSDIDFEELVCKYLNRRFACQSKYTDIMSRYTMYDIYQMSTYVDYDVDSLAISFMSMIRHKSYAVNYSYKVDMTAPFILLYYAYELANDLINNARWRR